MEKPKKKKKKNKVFGFLKDAADFLILDDVKTLFDPKASFLDKGLAIFSVTPTGKALKAGRLGFKLVRNSPVGKVISKKVDWVTSKGTGKTVKLPTQGEVDAGVRGAPKVDAGKQGKHVLDHPNSMPGKKTHWP